MSDRIKRESNTGLSLLGVIEMSDEAPDQPELGDVVDFEVEQADDKLWTVLFEEDYHNFVKDIEGNIGVLLDLEQSTEVFHLAAEQIATLSQTESDSDDVIRNMIDELEKRIDGDNQ